MSRLDRALDGIENPDKEDHNDIVHMPRKGLDLSKLVRILEIFSPVTLEELVDGYHNEPKTIPKPKQKKPPTIKVEKSVDVVKKNITNVKKPTKKQLADAKLSLFKKSSMFKMFSSVLPESTMTPDKHSDKVIHSADSKQLTKEEFDSYVSEQSTTFPNH